MGSSGLHIYYISAICNKLSAGQSHVGPSLYCVWPVQVQEDHLLLWPLQAVALRACFKLLPIFCSTQEREKFSSDFSLPKLARCHCILPTRASSARRRPSRLAADIAGWTCIEGGKASKSCLDWVLHPPQSAGDASHSALFDRLPLPGCTKLSSQIWHRACTIKTCSSVHYSI